MKYITVLLAAFAAAPSAFAYTFTTCNAGCTGTGCGGQASTFSVGPGSTQGVPGTQCIIWPANGEAGSWEVCNSDGSCTSGTNINCFDAEDGSGRKICNTSGTESIKIDS